MNQGTKLATRTSRHVHAIRFYEDNQSLCRIVAEFLGDGLIADELALIVATPERRAGIVSELRVRDFDVDTLQAAGDLLPLDAREM